MKQCIDCGSLQVVERRRCKECAQILNRERVKQYHKKDKIRYGIVNCSICGEKLIKGRPNQVAHGRCRRKTVENYNNVTRVFTNTIGRQTILNLRFKLTPKMVIHHVNENPEDNRLMNLWIISRSNHNSLHRFLQQNWSLFLKENGSNSENCWNNLRDQLTTTWLETTSVNVIKITDIGQSAAEPLNENSIYMFSNEEGSETMYRIPKRKVVGKDIVQATTAIAEP